MSLLPNTIANADPLDADPVMENFQALEAALGALTNDNIADAAGIESSKLAAPNCIWMLPLPVLPIASGAAVSGAASFDTLPTGWTTLVKSRVKLRSGQTAWLCAVEIDVQAAAAGGGSNPELQVLLAGVAVGGAGTPVTTAGLYTQALANPFDNPLLPVSDGDTIEVQIRQSAAGTATIRGVTCHLYFKGTNVP